MAATTHRWHASTDNYATVGNWDSGVIPGTGGAALDTTIFDGVSQQSVLTNLDRTAAGAPGNNPLYRIVTMPAYGGNIGGPGNNLKQELDSTTQGTSRLLHRGSGQVYYEGPAGGFQDVYVDSSHPLSTPAVTLSGVIRNVFVNRGRVEIASSCTIAGTLWCCGLAGNVVIAATGTGPVRLIANGGSVWNYRATLAGNTIVVSRPGTLVQYGLLVDNTQIYHLGGDFTYSPSTAPTAADNPDIFTDRSALRLDASPYDIVFNDLVIGPNAAISGSAEQVSGVYSPLSTFIDMREEYP